MISKAAFAYFLKEKQRHSKLNEVNYCEVKIQSYLKDCRFSREERKLLTSLRSRCYNAKTNFKKLHKSDLKCRLGCDSPESQLHIFTQCQHTEIPSITVHENIYSDTDKQNSCIKSLICIDKKRQHIIENVPPGDARARAQVS